jgi:hypothetical protein
VGSLGENGYVEGRNVAIEHHFVEGDYDRLPELAADLVNPAARWRTASARPFAASS